MVDWRGRTTATKPCRSARCAFRQLRAWVTVATVGGLVHRLRRAPDSDEPPRLELATDLTAATDANEPGDARSAADLRPGGALRGSRAVCEDQAMLGYGWQMQWARVRRRLDDVRAVYARREGGTDAAVDAVQSFLRQFTTSRTGSGMIHGGG
jgi:hypothetical protein